MQKETKRKKMVVKEDVTLSEMQIRRIYK